MNHIKKLYEYEDSDLLDLLGDLSTLGFEKPQGWVFQWESTTENPLVEFVIASNPVEAMDIYKQMGWFGADVAVAEKGGKRFSTIGDVFKYLIDQKLIFNADIIYGLDLAKGVKETKGYGSVTRKDPFAVVNKLNNYFENGAERYAREVRSKSSYNSY